jgi:hypothetical protein
MILTVLCAAAFIETFGVCLLASLNHVRIVYLIMRDSTKRSAVSDSYIVAAAVMS